VRLSLVRKEERKHLHSSSLQGWHYEALAYKKVGRNMDPVIIVSGFEENIVFSHEGEEFIYTLEGTHEFVYDDQTYVLNEGDSIYFDSIIPHSGRSLGKKKAKLLAVMYWYKRTDSAHFVENRLAQKRKPV
jgi:mannose-6-phosphate isomerase-like protein (cupin superfamily)